MSNSPATTAANAPAEQTHPGTDLVGTDQDRGIHRGGTSAWTPEQRDQLRALGGLDEASDGDLAMLKAVADRSGLDPFVKQIYLVGRRTKTGGYRGEPERWETKWTVQVGIDGFRAVSHRYAQEQGAELNIGKPVFYDDQGSPQPIWLARWGNPAAAEVTITLGGTSATAVAVWDEYVQTKRNGEPNSMWEKMPSVMLAKCAEAQAHRRVCPLTAGMYEDAEMSHADGPRKVRSSRSEPAGKGRQAARAALGIAPANDTPEVEAEVADDPEPAESESEREPAAEDSPATPDQIGQMMATLDEAQVTPDERPSYIAGLVGRQINRPEELTAGEVANIVEFTRTGELRIEG